MSGDSSNSVPLAEVLRSWDGIGQLWVSDRGSARLTVSATDDDSDDTIAPDTLAGGLTLVLQSDAAIDGLTWARRQPGGIRALVLIDPVIRPLSRRELLDAEMDRSAQDLVTKNASWLSTSHVPKLLVSTRAAAGRADDSTFEWAAGHVRNLTLEAVPAGGGPDDLLGRVLRGWLGHISW